MSRYILGITGASGSVYALRLLEELLAHGHEVHLVATDNGRKVIGFETGADIEPARYTDYAGTLTFHAQDDLFAPISSGSFKTEGMAVVPCSMATLGALAAGAPRGLLARAADVCLKERRRLVLVPREMPLSQIHLKNMLTLSEAGATILPPSPGFYHHPQTLDDMINFVVSRILDALGIDNNLYEKWR